MSKSSYKNSLLQITLPTLTSFNEHHRELIELAVNYSSISLIIHVSCKEIEFYSNYPTECWIKIRDLLNFLYISGTKVSYENFKHFLEIDVIFEKWNGYNIELVKEKIFDVFFGSEAEQSRLQEFNRTFDHLHAGHKILLTLTAWISGKRLICGVTDDCMLKEKKFKEYIEPINTRIAKVSKFLNAIHQNLLYEVVPIYDAYGPTITDPDIHALVVSKETVSGAELVNDERQKRGFGILEIFVIEVISSTNPSLEEVELKKLKLSSTYLRELCKNSEAK
ncbi:10366_t:CDS:2 [Gigaspora rosea]|nr:10366_t:CDS:2 [Gigaspora rosea]